MTSHDLSALPPSDEREGAEVLYSYTMGASVADGDLSVVVTLDRLNTALTLGSVSFYYEPDGPEPDDDYLDPRLLPDVLAFPGDPSFADVVLGLYRWWASIWSEYQSDLAWQQSDSLTASQDSDVHDGLSESDGPEIA